MGAPVPRIERICETCGAKFLALESCIRQGSGRYCSRVCSGLGRRRDVQRKCLRCGASFTVKNWIVTKDGGKYCTFECSIRTGEDSPGWKGGAHINNGYRVIDRRRERREGEGSGRIFEHRLMMEKIIGRKLTTDEVVHHIDENRLNNSPENLQILTRAEHLRLHLSANGRWSRKYKNCVSCGETTKEHAGRGFCTRCYWKYGKQTNA